MFEPVYDMGLLMSQGADVNRGVLFRRPVTREVTVRTGTNFIVNVVVLALVPCSIRPSVLPTSEDSFKELYVCYLGGGVISTPRDPKEVAPTLMLVVPESMASLCEKDVEVSGKARVITVAEGGGGP